MQILAWNPRTFLSDYVEILPAMVSTDTAKEVGTNKNVVVVIYDFSFSITDGADSSF